MVEVVKTPTEARSSRKERRVELFSKKHRSAVTNGRKILIHADHRTAWLRRFRDLIAEHVADLGGEQNISGAEMALVRAAAQLRIQLEALEAQWAEHYDGIAPVKRLQDYQKTVGALRRVLQTLGLKRRSRDITPDLQTYLRQRQEEHGAEEED